jgi:hypothetical protein
MSISGLRRIPSIWMCAGLMIAPRGEANGHEAELRFPQSRAFLVQSLGAFKYAIA